MMNKIENNWRPTNAMYRIRHSLSFIHGDHHEGESIPGLKLFARDVDPASTDGRCPLTRAVITSRRQRRFAGHWPGSDRVLSRVTVGKLFSRSRIPGTVTMPGPYPDRGCRPSPDESSNDIGRRRCRSSSARLTHQERGRLYQLTHRSRPRDVSDG